MKTLKQNTVVRKRVSQLVETDVYVNCTQLVHSLFNTNEDVFVTFQEAVNKALEMRFKEEASSLFGIIQARLKRDGYLLQETREDWVTDLIDTLEYACEGKADYDDVFEAFSSCENGFNLSYEMHLDELYFAGNDYEVSQYFAIDPTLGARLLELGAIVFELHGLTIWALEEAGGPSNQWYLFKVASNLLT